MSVRDIEESEFSPVAAAGTPMRVVGSPGSCGTPLRTPTRCRRWRARWRATPRRGVLLFRDSGGRWRCAIPRTETGFISLEIRVMVWRERSHVTDTMFQTVVTKKKMDERTADRVRRGAERLREPACRSLVSTARTARVILDRAWVSASAPLPRMASSRAHPGWSTRPFASPRPATVGARATRAGTHVYVYKLYIQARVVDPGRQYPGYVEYG